MNITLIDLIKHERKEQNLTKKQLYTGLCSPATATRIEQGERIPDYLTLHAILDRLGLSMRLFCAYLSLDEISYLKWRRDVVITASLEDDSKLDSITDREPECDTLNTRLMLQYRDYIKGMNYCRQKEYELALECFSRSLKYTNVDLACHNLEGIRASSFELFLYLLMMHIQFQNKMNMAPYIEKTIEYMKKRAAHNKNIGNLMMLAFCIYFDHTPEGRNVGFEKWVVDWIRKKQTLFHATDVLRRVDEVAYHDVICAFTALYQKYGVESEYRFWVPCWTDSGVEYQKDYIRGGRLVNGKTQSEVAEGILEVENYSRIESGQVKPLWRNYKKISQRIGIDDRYITMDIETSQIDVFRLSKKIIQLVNANDVVGAALAIECFEECAEDNVTNRRFLSAYQCVLKQRKVTDAQKMEQLLNEVMQEFTKEVKLKNIGKRVYIYSMPDMVFINTIAAIMERQKKYKETRDFLEKVCIDFAGQNEKMETRVLERMGVLLNLCRIRSDVEDYKAAFRVSSDIIKMIVSLKEPFYLTSALLEHVYNMVHGAGEEDVEEYAEILLAIARFLGDANIVNYLEQLMLKNGKESG